MSICIDTPDSNGIGISRERADWSNRVTLVGVRGCFISNTQSRGAEIRVAEIIWALTRHPVYRFLFRNNLRLSIRDLYQILGLQCVTEVHNYNGYNTDFL